MRAGGGDLQAGDVTEIGTHDELLKANGRYAMLYNKQMGIAV